MSLRTRFFLAFTGLGLLLILIASLSFYLLESAEVRREQRAGNMRMLARVATVCGEAVIERNHIPAINFMRTMDEEKGLVAADCVDPLGIVQAALDAKMI